MRNYGIPSPRSSRENPQNTTSSVPLAGETPERIKNVLDIGSTLPRKKRPFFPFWTTKKGGRPI